MKIHRFYTKQPLGEENIKIENKSDKELLHQFFIVLKFNFLDNIIYMSHIIYIYILFNFFY